MKWAVVCWSQPGIRSASPKLQRRVFTSPSDSWLVGVCSNFIKYLWNQKFNIPNLLSSWPVLTFSCFYSVSQTTGSLLVRLPSSCWEIWWSLKLRSNSFIMSLLGWRWTAAWPPWSQTSTPSLDTSFWKTTGQFTAPVTVVLSFIFKLLMDLCVVFRCLFDSQLTDSSSRFLPRSQDDRLQFELEAFRFQQDDSGVVRLKTNTKFRLFKIKI